MLFQTEAAMERGKEELEMDPGKWPCYRISLGLVAWKVGS